jgi:hypothetical protein
MRPDLGRGPAGKPPLKPSAAGVPEQGVGLPKLGKPMEPVEKLAEGDGGGYAVPADQGDADLDADDLPGEAQRVAKRFAEDNSTRQAAQQGKKPAYKHDDGNDGPDASGKHSDHNSSKAEPKVPKGDRKWADAAKAALGRIGKQLERGQFPPEASDWVKTLFGRGYISNDLAGDVLKGLIRVADGSGDVVTRAAYADDNVKVGGLDALLSTQQGDGYRSYGKNADALKKHDAGRGELGYQPQRNGK